MPQTIYQKTFNVASNTKKDGQAEAVAPKRIRTQMNDESEEKRQVKAVAPKRQKRKKEIEKEVGQQLLVKCTRVVAV